MEKIKHLAIRRINSIIGLLIIGALGSGLWDMFLKNFLFSLGGVFVKITSSIYSGYIDSLYKYVGKIDSTLVLLPSLFMIVLIMFSPLLLLLLYNRFYRRFIRQSSAEENVKKESFKFKIVDTILNSKKKSYLVILLLTLPLSLLYTDMLIKEISNTRATKYIDRSIEIIRPKISESEFLTLRSEFRQIDNRQKVNDILEKITQIADSNKIKLAEIKLYGISIKNH